MYEDEVHDVLYPGMPSPLSPLENFDLIFGIFSFFFIIFFSCSTSVQLENRIHEH